MVVSRKHKLSMGGEALPDSKEQNISEESGKRSPHKGAFEKQVETLKSPTVGQRVRTKSGEEGELILQASDCGEDIVIMKNAATGKRMVRSAGSVIFNPSPSFGGDFFPDEEANIPLSIEGDDSDELFPSASITSLGTPKNDRPPQPDAYLDWKRRRGHLFGLKFDKKYVKKEVKETPLTPLRREEYQVVTNVSHKRRIKTSTSIILEEAPISRRQGSISMMKSQKKVTGNRFLLKDGSLIKSKKQIVRSGSSMSGLCGVVKHNPFLTNDGGKSSKKRRSTRRRKKKRVRRRMTRDEALPGITERPEVSSSEEKEEAFEKEELQEEECSEQPDIFKDMDPELAAAITAAYEKATRLQEEGKVAEAIDAHMKAGQLLNNALFQLR